MAEETKPKKAVVAKRIVVGIVLAMVLFFVLLPASLYIPMVQDWVCGVVVSFLNSSSTDYEYHIGNVRIGFPLQLRVNDVILSHRSDGKVLVSVGSLQTGLDDIPINQPYFILNRLEVHDVKVGMDSLTQSFGMLGTLADLSVKRIEIDPESSRLRIGEVCVSDPDVLLFVGPSSPDDDETESQPWAISIGRAVLTHGHVGLDMSDKSLFDALVSISGSPYLEYQHLDFDNIGLAVNDVRYDRDLITAQVEQLVATERNCHLSVEQLAVDFRMEDDVIEAKSIDLKLTDNDYLRGDALLDLSLTDSICPSGLAQMSIEMGIGHRNLERIAATWLPGLAEHWVDEQATVRVNAYLMPDTLDLRQLSLSMPGHVDIEVEAFGTDLFDAQRRSVGATLKGKLLHPDFLLSTFVDAPSRRSYQLPDSLVVNAEATQRGSKYTARVDLMQHDANVLSADAAYDESDEAYRLQAQTWGLNLSDFVPEVVGEGLTAQLQADGRRFVFPGRTTRLDATVRVDTLRFAYDDGKRGQLTELQASASLINGQYMVDVHAPRQALCVDTHLEGSYTRDTISAHGYVNLPAVNLASLPYGLAQPALGTLGFYSRLDGAYDWHHDADIHLLVDSLTYVDDVLNHHFDNILVDVRSHPGLLDADLQGGDASICVNMDRSIQELPDVLARVLTEVSHQVDSVTMDFNAVQRLLPQISADIHMERDNPFYTALNYQFGYSFQSVDVAMVNDDELYLNGQIVSLQDQVGDLDFDTISVAVLPMFGVGSLQAEAYTYGIHAMHIDPRARRTYDIHADGMLMPDSLTLGFTYVNGNYLTLYDVMASLALGNDSLSFHLEKDPIIYEQAFTVNPDNYLSIMQYRHPELGALNSRARMNLRGKHDLDVRLYTRPAPNAPSGNQLLFLVRNLDLGYATNLMDWSGDAGGTLSTVAMVNIFPDSITSRLRTGIRNFHLGEYRADTLGFNGTLDMVAARRDLSGTLTVDSIVKLQLDAALADSVDVRASIQDFPLPLLNAFLPQPAQLWGNVVGRLSLTGPDMDHTRMDAALSMQQAGLLYSDLDARLQFPQDTLTIVDGRLQLRDYRVQAAGTNPFCLRGVVDLKRNLTNPDLDLRISGTKVDLINSRKLRLPSQYLCGKLPLTADIKVRGTLSRLDVDGTLRLLSGTNLKYYMTDDPLQASSRVDQLVEFVNFRQLDRRIASGDMKRRPLQEITEEELNVGLKIEIDKDVKVSAYLAGTDNNRVDIEGGGSLNLRVGNDGDLLMNGVYDITSGYVDYKLPILPMVKTFNISNVSQVTWQGVAADNPDINIQATEEVKATVSDGLGTRIVKFLVSISIQGTLEALNMTFDCSAPEDGAVNSEIATFDADERSKAALMLLIAQTYTGPSNSSSMGLSTANAALNSMINRQMTSMLGNMKGTSIDLGIDTYNTQTGSTRTNYSVKVSQQLFNDRFRATIGGQISSGGEVGQSSGAQLSDMSLEWLIKRDGSHYMRLFRRTNYESVLEGELVETGVSYVQERSGYKFRHLFIPTSQKRQQRMLDIIREMQAREEQEDNERRNKKAEEGTPPEVHDTK